ncbi:MAG: outer membrane protein assembly factor BamE [Sphingomonas sp.]|jgi:outer membrane protein assembly factor BamE (lipoprotein component of BamABCDE complex)
MRVPAAKPALVAAMALAGLSLSACTSLKGHNGYIIDADLVNSVQPRVDNKASVAKVLGKPTLTGQFSDDDWIYLSRDTRFLGYTKPKASAQQTIRIRFDDKGTVTSINKTGLELASNIAPYGKVTPTLGRKQSFFQQVFGNIGTVGAGIPGGGAGGPGQNP